MFSELRNYGIGTSATADRFRDRDNATGIGDIAKKVIPY